ncbi:putative cytosolic NADP isocitrate dehydrogenase [Tanacetum coccineum]
MFRKLNKKCWRKAICIGRHGFGDQHKATDAVIKGLGKLKMVFVPEGGGKTTDLEVYNFIGAGGVALSMYNTDMFASKFSKHEEGLDELLEQEHKSNCFVDPKSQEVNTKRETDDDDEDQKALMEIVREHSGLQDEQLKMQYECSTSYATVNKLKAHIEHLDTELKTKSKELSESVLAIKERETLVKNLKEDLDNQVHEFEADMEDLIRAKDYYNDFIECWANDMAEQQALNIWKFSNTLIISGHNIPQDSPGKISKIGPSDVNFLGSEFRPLQRLRSQHLEDVAFPVFCRLKIGAKLKDVSLSIPRKEKRVETDETLTITLDFETKDYQDKKATRTRSISELELQATSQNHTQGKDEALFMLIDFIKAARKNEAFFLLIDFIKAARVSKEADATMDRRYMCGAKHAKGPCGSRLETVWELQFIVPSISSSNMSVMIEISAQIKVYVHVSQDVMKIEPDIENMTIVEYLKMNPRRQIDYGGVFAPKVLLQVFRCRKVLVKIVGKRKWKYRNKDVDDRLFSKSVLDSEESDFATMVMPPITFPLHDFRGVTNMEEIWNIMIKDVERLKRLLTPIVQALPKPKPVVQPYVPPIPFPNELKVVRQEEASKKVTDDIASVPMHVSEVTNEVMQHLTSQTIYITPPGDAYVALATNPILVELLNEFYDDLLSASLTDEEAGCNPMRDVDFHDPFSSPKELREHSETMETIVAWNPLMHPQHRVKFDRYYPRWFLEEDVAIAGKDERNPCKSSHHLEKIENPRRLFSGGIYSLKGFFPVTL